MSGGPKFTPARDRSGPKPLRRINNSMYPEVRMKGNGEVVMTYNAFAGLPPRNVEKMLAEQRDRLVRGRPGTRSKH